MSLMTKQKVYKVELARRITANTWEASWEDITQYFIERNGGVSSGDLQDDTLEGEITQATVSLRFDNTTGAFNPEGSVSSLWDGVDEFLYHSRIRYWEYYVGETPTYPLLDGLIARSPEYKEKFTADLIVNSKLDILRDHFILENLIGRIKRANSTAIITYINYLFNSVYPSLGVDTNNSLFRNDILYDNIDPYSDNLLDIASSVTQDGGGIGGLRKDNKLVYPFQMILIQ